MSDQGDIICERPTEASKNNGIWKNLAEFEKVTGLTLGDILYSESKNELFKDWLQRHEELDKNYLFVNYAMIEYLQDKQEKDQQYTTGEKINIRISIMLLLSIVRIISFQTLRKFY